MSIKENWDSFKDQVIHKGAGPVQVQEMQRAFYGGAAVMFAETMKISIEDISEAEGLNGIKNLNQELEDFSNNITKASL